MVINPREDEEFEALARELANRSASAPELQAALRHRYPRSVVRSRRLDGERLAIWYVYRDGNWVAPQ
jgi:hypothetical protein